MDKINNSTGIRYRELQRTTGIAYGKLEYHLKILEKLKQIKVVSYHERKSTRYYTSAEESRIIEFVDRKTTREIVQLLLERDRCTCDDIMKHTKRVGSTISWHLSRLQKGRIISVTNRGEHRVYTLRNKGLIAKLLNGSKN